MKTKKLRIVTVMSLVLLLCFPAAALAEGGFSIDVSDPDSTAGVDNYIGSTVNTALSVPRVGFGDERALGTLRITEKTGAEASVSEGNKVKISLPLGTCYMQTPTRENYRRYVTWPAEIDGMKNRISDNEGQPGLRFVEGTPRSITVEVGHLDPSGKTMAIDFVFDQEGYSTVRLTRLIESGREYISDPEGPVTRGEFFLLLSDITRSIPSCPLNWADDESPLAERFPDLDTMSQSELNRIKPLVDSGVIQGYPGGEMRPSEYITRAEAVNLVGKILPFREDLSGFSDPLPGWGTGILNAVHQGIAYGYPDGTFRPGQPITRAETLVLLQKTLESYQARD
ncbi:MAG: S-layer homology domain-containing protein [Firmicutes bacterium]|nr:S-layer homology domain-containing protein [Bacillota bacterium]